MATEGVKAAAIIAGGIAPIIAGSDAPFLDYSLTMTDPDSDLRITVTLPLTAAEAYPGAHFGPNLVLSFGDRDAVFVRASMDSNGFMIGTLRLGSNAEEISDLDLTITEA